MTIDVSNADQFINTEGKSPGVWDIITGVKIVTIELATFPADIQVNWQSDLHTRVMKRLCREMASTSLPRTTCLIRSMEAY